MTLDKQQEVQSAAAGDSISSVGVPVNVKDYTPSEVYTHEPPPAYKKPTATTIQIARIAAFTVIACTIILGSCIIASSWIEATASCSQYVHTEALLHHQQQNDDVAERPSYQALIDPLQSDESSESKQESFAGAAPIPLSQNKEATNGVGSDVLQGSIPSQSPFESQGTPIQIKLPLQLDFDEIAGALMEKNQRSRLNCVVEKKRAVEVTDHQPKMVNLPFGVNITTDPRYEHVTGEKMAIYCESGHEQRHVPVEAMQQQQQQQQQRQHHHQQQQQQQQQLLLPRQLPPSMVVPMPLNLPLMMSQHTQGVPNHASSLPSHMNHVPISMMNRIPQDDSSLLQKEDGPITIIAREEHIIPVFQPVMSDMRPLASNSIVEGRSLPEKITYHPAGPEARMMPEGRMLQSFVIPESRQAALPLVEARAASPTFNGAMPAIPSDIVRPPPPPAFQKIPIHVPTILQQVENQQQTLNDNVLDEESENEPRPHYVQPRSVRSVDSQLHKSEKRQRRYACSCTC